MYTLLYAKQINREENQGFENWKTVSEGYCIAVPGTRKCEIKWFGENIFKRIRSLPEALAKLGNN